MDKIGKTMNNPDQRSPDRRTVLAMLASTGTMLAPAHASEVSPFATVRARPTRDFLNSIGIVTTFPDRGQPINRTVEMINYCGFRWIRAGIEGLSTDGPNTIETMLQLNRETGALLNWGLVSGNSDLEKLLETGLVLARNEALLAFEGNNEPNNWPVEYEGQVGGGMGSWLPVARLQRDFYQMIKDHPELRNYPVWSVTDPGAQIDNTGLQFLEIPAGAGTLMPDGTRYADVANVHNYIYHPASPGLSDNKVWKAADPTPASRVNGLYSNFGRTWRNKFQGHSAEEILALPRVTTETGVPISEKVPEALHGLHLMNVYLAQFKRGYSHTSVYLLRDRTDESGDQAFGFFAPDYTPRLAARYLHNLTAILADRGPTLWSRGSAAQVNLKLEGQTDVVHDLLLRRSDGMFQYVIWGEQLYGSTETLLRFESPPDRLRIYNPVSGTDPIRSLNAPSAVSLTLSDHPMILEFTQS